MKKQRDGSRKGGNDYSDSDFTHSFTPFIDTLDLSGEDTRTG